MSDASDDGTRNVLHIREPRATPSHGPSDPDWLTRLSSAERIVVDECPDVYRGLARLCRGARRAYGAAIVCVDQLTPAEFEFFDVAGRVCRDVDVYVYGWRRSQSRISQAIARGARGEVDEGVIERLIARLGIGDVERYPTPTPAPEPAVDPRYARPEPDSGDGGDAQTDSAMGDDRPASPARVPWLKYDGGPSRAAPSRAAPSEFGVSGGTAGAARARQPVEYKPLLTDEELRALIGDDRPSLGPERASDRPDDDPSHSGDRG